MNKLGVISRSAKRRQQRKRKKTEVTLVVQNMTAESQAVLFRKEPIELSVGGGKDGKGTK